MPFYPKTGFRRARDGTAHKTVFFFGFRRKIDLPFWALPLAGRVAPPPGGAGCFPQKRLNCPFAPPKPTHGPPCLARTPHTNLPVGAWRGPMVFAMPKRGAVGTPPEGAQL